MRLLHVAVALSVGLLQASSALAGSIELEAPGGGGGGRPDPTIVIQLPFTFSAVGGAGGGCMFGSTSVPLCEFTNNTGVDWQRLTISAFPGTDFTGCGGLYGFSACNPVDGSGLTPSVVQFSGGTGWRNGTSLKFVTTGWDPSTTFTVSSSVPEPSSFLPVLLAVAAFAAGGRARMRYGVR